MSWRTTAGTMKGSNSKTLQARPQDGTKLRASYDLLMASPLKPMLASEMGIANKSGSYYSTLEQLRNYGLDVRVHSRQKSLGRGRGQRPGMYWLVGYVDEHGEYVDLLARHLADHPAAPVHGPMAQPLRTDKLTWSQGDRCHYCRVLLLPPALLGRPEHRRSHPRCFTVDHMDPKCDGGVRTVPACEECNRIKGNDPYALFVAFMTAHGNNSTVPAHGSGARKTAYRRFRNEVIRQGLAAMAADTEADTRLQLQDRDTQDHRAEPTCTCD